MREVIIVSTRNTQVARFQVENGANFGTLKAIVGHEAYDWDNLTAVENINKTALMSDESLLPDGNIKIFLRPTKTKSGANIREIFRVNKTLQEQVKTAYGKNYTVLKNSVLEDFYNSSQFSVSKSTQVAVNSSEEFEALKARVSIIEKQVQELFDNREEVCDVKAESSEDTTEYNLIVGEFDFLND